MDQVMVTVLAMGAMLFVITLRKKEVQINSVKTGEAGLFCYNSL